MKNWILNLSFVQDAFKHSLSEAKKEWVVEAFKNARKDVEEMMVDRTDEKSDEKALKMVNDLLSPVDLTKIVTLDKGRGIVYIGGKRVEEGQMNNLKSEAEFLMNSELWQLMQETPKELAQRAMFVDSENLDGLKKGRSILYALSTQKNILEVLRSYGK